MGTVPMRRRHRVGVQGGIGWIGLATMAVAACLLAYPAVWASRIAHDPRIRRNRDPLYVVFATAAMIAFIVPASFLNIGWLAVPTLILMLSISYAVVHAEVTRRFTKDAMPEPGSVYLGFALPMLGLAVIVLAASIMQLAGAAEAGQAGIAAVGSSVLLSFAVLGVGPPLVAAVGISVGFALQRRAARLAPERPLFR